MKSLFRHTGGRLLFISLAFFLCLFLWSCKNDDSPKKSASESPGEGIEETLERGPAKLTIKVDKGEISIAERISLIISVDIEEDYEVKMPSFGEKLEQFGIVDYHNTQPRLAKNNRKIIERSYVLEPFLSGDYKISPMKIFFFRKNSGESERHFIESPELTIKVTSLLPDDLKNMKLNDIIPPVAYPRSYKSLIFTGGIILLIILSAAVLFYYKKRKNHAGITAVSLKAHEIAYRELKTLVDEDLVDRGEIKTFYMRLSAIVRRYIENRFGLRAPEQTTEEFLSGLEKAAGFPSEYKPLLNDFLRHCDLVKFAKFQPDQDDIQKSFDSCRAFIQGTEERD